MPESDTPERTKPNPFPLVWVVPVIALLVGGYMVFKELSGEGPSISITFQEGAGLEAGKTELRHKGLAVGVVESVSLTDDLSQVVAVVVLDKSAKGLARSGSKFWILRPQIGFEGVTGLDTIFSGPTIQVSPGQGPFAKSFEGLSRAPLEGSELGYHFILEVERLGSLKIGSPVLYREVKVGEIVETRLAPDAASVLVRILVNSPYDRLVRTDSVFWNVSGIDMKVGLLGAKIQTSSIEALLTGGVMFATPESDSELAPPESAFELRTEHKEEWLKWNREISLE